MVLPQFVNTGFQVLFHSPPGVLFTFPSQYCALSVTEEYLALRGGPRSFPQGFSCLVVLWILLCLLELRLRGFHPLWLVFPVPFPCPYRSRPQSEPRNARTPVWALPISLAATLGIDVSFSSSGYLDVSVHRVPLHDLFRHSCLYSVMDTWSLSMWVSPFRDPWIIRYLLLPTAFRSLSRLSSALSAKASTLRSF